MNPDDSLTFSEKLEIVLMAAKASPQISAAITFKLLSEMEQMVVGDIPVDVWKVLEKASRPLQHVFMLGGLTI